MIKVIQMTNYLDEMNDEESYFLLCAIDRNILMDTLSHKHSSVDEYQIEMLTGTYAPHIVKRCPFCIYFNPIEHQEENHRLCFKCKAKSVCIRFELLQRLGRSRAIQYMKYLRSRHGKMLIAKLQENEL